MKVEDRIKRWREEEHAEETEGHIELLCDAEEALRRLRRELRAAGRPRCPVHSSQCIKPDGHDGFHVFESETP